MVTQFGHTVFACYIIPAHSIVNSDSIRRAKQAEVS